MLGLLSKLFGSKSDRDIKQIQPLVEQIKAVYPQLAALSNDELRVKTQIFKQTIASFLADIDAELAEVKTQSEALDLSIAQKTAIYESLDRLQKERDEQLEKVLLQILPEAFAVVKETARRFTEDKSIEEQFERI